MKINNDYISINNIRLTKTFKIGELVYGSSTKKAI